MNDWNRVENRVFIYQCPIYKRFIDVPAWQGNGGVPPRPSGYDGCIRPVARARGSSTRRRRSRDGNKALEAARDG